VDEFSQDKSLDVLNLELKNLDNDYLVKTIQKRQERHNSFSYALNYALENDYEYIMVINEGWEDNIFEFINIIKSREFINYDLITSCRTANEFSLGAIYNFISNILASIITGKKVKDTKGDSINIYKLDCLKQLQLANPKRSLFFFDILLVLLRHNKKILFSDVENGLNYRSYVRLNTKRFIDLVISLIKFKLKKS
jgi:hypothetical protein